MRKLERSGKWLLDRSLGWMPGAGETPPVPDPAEVTSILVVRPHNQMGDMLLGTPLFRALREGYPHSRVTLVASPDNAEIMFGHPDVDHLLVFDKKRFQRHPADARSFLSALRGRSWDLVIMPTTVSFSVTSTILARLAGGRLRVGSDGSAYGRAIGRRVFHLRVPCRWTREHQSDRNLDFARALSLGVSSRTPSMGLYPEERSWARAELGRVQSPGRRAVGIHPGAGKPPNRWPVERFAGLASMLANDPGNQVYVMVGPKEGALREAVRAEGNPRVVCHPDLTLRQAAALIAEYDLFVCNDTGVMHVGAALGTPTLALFGPTDPHIWAPLSPDLHWLRARGGRMETLAFEDVHAKVLDLLARVRVSGETTYAPDAAPR